MRLSDEDVVAAADYFRRKALQCRRLINGIEDAQAIRSLTSLAEEFEAKAKAADAESHLTALSPTDVDD